METEPPHYALKALTLRDTNGVNEISHGKGGGSYLISGFDLKREIAKLTHSLTGHGLELFKMSQQRFA